MIRFYLTIALLTFAAALSEPALSAQASTNPPPAQTELIRVSKAVAMRNALMLLTGVHDVIIGRGDNKNVARVMYEIEPLARDHLNDDIAALNALLEPTQKTLNDFAKQASDSNGGQPLPDADLSPAQKSIQRTLNGKVQEIMDSMKLVAALVHISRGNLKEPVPGEIEVPLMCPKDQPTPAVACVIDPKGGGRLTCQS